MKNLTIEIPKGFKVKSFDMETGEIKFESTKKVTDRIKTIEDVLEANEITKKEFDKSCKGLEEDEINYRLVKLICKALNEEWTPDWDNSSEHKYQPWFNMSSSGFRFDVYDSWYSGSRVGSRLCFRSVELAKYAGEQFTGVYEKFMIN